MTHQLAKFEAVNCSGFLFPGPASVVASALIFERIRIPSNADVIRDLVRRRRIRLELPDELSVETIPSWESWEPEAEGLTADQRESMRHLFLVGLFFMEAWRELIPEVLQCDGVIMPTQSELIDAVDDIPRQKSLTASWGVDPGPDLADYRKMGCVPLIGCGPSTLGSDHPRKSPRAREVASALGMRAAELVMPRTKPVSAEVILEARHRLGDELPPFWAAMLRLSREVEDAPVADDEEFSAWVNDIVDSTVLPAAIELRKKLEMERKSWFHRILAPIGSGIRLLIGAQTVPDARLVEEAISISLQVASRREEYRRAVTTVREGGAAFLLDAHDYLAKNV